jgi:large subunit ribosomal protein L14
MKGLGSSMTRGLPVGAMLKTSDNSGGKQVQIIGVRGIKTVKGRIPAACVGDLIVVRVVKGRPDVRSKVFLAIIVSQAKEYKRPNGIRVKFENNSCVLLKDDKGNPKGTILKGPIAKEATERWPAVARLASIIV